MLGFSTTYLTLTIGHISYSVPTAPPVERARRSNCHDSDTFIEFASPVISATPQKVMNYSLKLFREGYFYLEKSLL